MQLSPIRLGGANMCYRNANSCFQLFGVTTRMMMIKTATFNARLYSHCGARFPGYLKQLRAPQKSVRNFSNRPWQVQNRRQNWGSNNPIFDGDNLIYSIIGLNIFAFGAWKYSENDRKTRRFLLDNFMISSNGVLREFRIHTFLTSIFFHRDPWHLASNLVTVYFFGRSCLQYLGGPRFLALYVGGGLVASFAQVLCPHIVPRNFPHRFKVSTNSSTSGASSAAAAVVTWCILKNPRSTVLLFFVVPVPAAILGAGFLLIEVGNLFYGGNSGNAAHLGGAAFGAAFFALNS